MIQGRRALALGAQNARSINRGRPARDPNAQDARPFGAALRLMPIRRARDP